jgi:hypothetical protein
MNMLRKLHHFSALVIAVYACIHITNHLVGLSGVDSHIEFMRKARLVYRQPAVEALLLLSVAFQICSGLALVVRGWKRRRSFISWLQAGSGIYLVLFFFNHVGAVLYGRNTLHLDTNFYYAAAGFYVPPLQFYFAPYYFLAVVALFTHLGCALYWRLQSSSRAAHMLAVALPVSIGSIISLLIVLSLAGVFYPVNVPPEYKASFSAHP